MKYDQLPVYKATYELLLDVYISGQNMSREYRYTLGEEIKKGICRLTTCIYRANLTQNKTPHITEAREITETVKLQIRLLHDLRQLPVARMARVNLRLESISKQLAAWHKSETEKTKKKKNETGQGESPHDRGQAERSQTNSAVH